MTDLRTAAMQQALDALEWAYGGEPIPEKEKAAIDALYAALAAPQPEPVAWLYRWKKRTSSEQLSRARWPESDLWIEVPLFESTPPDTEALIDQMLEAANQVSDLIRHQYTGTREGMTALQIACDATEAAIAAARKHKGLKP